METILLKNYCPKYLAPKDLVRKALSIKSYQKTDSSQMSCQKNLAKNHIPKSHLKNIFQKVVLKIVYAFIQDHL